MLGWRGCAHGRPIRRLIESGLLFHPQGRARGWLAAGARDRAIQSALQEPMAKALNPQADSPQWVRGAVRFHEPI